MTEQVSPSTEVQQEPDVVTGPNRPAFSPLGKRVVIARETPDVGGFKLTKELERECSPDIGTILQIGQIGFWNKWIKGIRPGRKVHFVKYSPVKVETNEYAFIYVNVDDLLGISK